MFELEARDHIMAFPCSICKNSHLSPKACEESCRLYDLTSLQSYELKWDVQKLIKNYK